MTTLVRNSINFLLVTLAYIELATATNIFLEESTLVKPKFCDTLFATLNSTAYTIDTQPIIIGHKHGTKFPFWIQCHKNVLPQTVATTPTTTTVKQASGPLLSSSSLSSRQPQPQAQQAANNTSGLYANISIEKLMRHPTSFQVDTTWRQKTKDPVATVEPKATLKAENNGDDDDDNAEFSFYGQRHREQTLNANVQLSDEETSKFEYILNVAQKCEAQISKICQSYRMGLQTQKSTKCPTCGLGDLNCDNVHNCDTDCGQIKSVNYPFNYANNHRCRWSILAPEGFYVNLSIVDFDIPSASNASKLGTCIFDYLTLIDGYTGKRLGCYCNENLPPPFILSPWNKLIIQFDTNSETTGRGFYFQYEFMRLELSLSVRQNLILRSDYTQSSFQQQTSTRGQSLDSNANTNTQAACPDNWLYYKGSCYRAYNEAEPLQWYDAENKCNAYGKGLDGHLVSILDRDEMSFIQHSLINQWKSERYRDYYIGLIDVTREGVYRWSDNNPMSYTDWQLKPILMDEDLPAQPDGGAYEDCTIIRYNSFSSTANWHDVPCSLGKHYHLQTSDKSLLTKHKWDYVDSYICKSDSYPLTASFSLSARHATKARRPLFSNEFINSLQNKNLTTANITHQATFGANSSNLQLPQTQIGQFKLKLQTQPSSSQHRQILSTLDDNKYFICDNLEIISVILKCDGITHCRDGSDEAESSDCNQLDCLESQFKCANGRCISIGQYCDFVDDCGDKSDESHCERHRCKLNEFRCQNGQCIPSSQRCDLLPDCSDSSDEGTLCNIGSNCNSDSTFQCYYGNCIPQYAVCDFQIDCPGKFHEDEDLIKCDLIAKSRGPIHNYFSPASYFDEGFQVGPSNSGGGGGGGGSGGGGSGGQLTGRELLLSQFRNFSLVQNCHLFAEELATGLPVTLLYDSFNSSFSYQAATPSFQTATPPNTPSNSPSNGSQRSATIQRLQQQQVGADRFCVKPSELIMAPTSEIAVLDNVLYTCKDYTRRHCHDLQHYHNLTSSGSFDVQPDPFDKTCQVECSLSGRTKQATEALTLVHHDSEFVLQVATPARATAPISFAIPAATVTVASVAPIPMPTLQLTSTALVAGSVIPAAPKFVAPSVQQQQQQQQQPSLPAAQSTATATAAAATAAAASTLPVNYDTSMDIISSLVSQSDSCMQSIQWKCFASDGRQLNCINQLATLTSTALKSTRAHSLSSLSSSSGSQRSVSLTQATAPKPPPPPPTAGQAELSSSTASNQHYEQLEATFADRSKKPQPQSSRLAPSMTLAELSISTVDLSAKNFVNLLARDNIEVRPVPNSKLPSGALNGSLNVKVVDGTTQQAGDWSEAVIRNKWLLPIVKANFKQSFIENVGGSALKTVHIKQVVYRIGPLVCSGSARLNHSSVQVARLTRDSFSPAQNSTLSSFKADALPPNSSQNFAPTTKTSSDTEQRQQSLVKFASQFVEVHGVKQSLDDHKFAKLSMLNDEQPLVNASSSGSLIELNSEAVCEPIKQNLFKCSSGNLIDNNWRCLYEFDRYGYQIGCRDVSHLLDCQHFECPARDYVKCSNSYCIPRRYICDGKWDCVMGDDEIGCARYVCPGQYKCANQSSCILLHQVCDGFRQCPMGDDEWFCDLQCPAQCDCIGHYISCRNANLTSLPSSQISKSARKLDLSYNLLGPNLSLSDFSSFRDLGELILHHNNIEVLIPRKFHQLRNLYKLDLSYNQIHSVKRGAFAGLRRVTQLLLEFNPELITIEPEAFLGLSSLQFLNISSSRIHNLKKNTFDGLTSLRHLQLRSNMINEIEDGAFRSLVSLVSLDLRGNDIRYFTKAVFADLKTLRNLSSDSFKFCCLMASQIPADRCLPLADEISDCEDLMSSVLQRACIWMAGLAACIGNSIVIVWRYRDRSARNCREQTLVNSTLLLSLGTADLLMGIYLIIIAFVDTWYRGRYIENADNWRQSPLCNLCGFLSTVSSEVSVFTLVFLAVNKFIVICKPIGSPYKFSLYWTHRLILISWLTALTIASLPLLIQPYFKGQFYARSGVCLAFHITNQKAAGWEYSIVVFLCLNLIAFVIIVTCYTLIHRTLSKPSLSPPKPSGGYVAGHNRQNSNQMNIAIIVTTNFVAWSPTIIMGFIALAGHAFPTSVYSWIAVLVLPVNSAINPMIYTIPSIRQQVRALIINHRLRKSNSVMAQRTSGVGGVGGGGGANSFAAKFGDKSLLSKRNVPPGYSQLRDYVRNASEINAGHLVNIALEISKDLEQKHAENKVYASLNLDCVHVSNSDLDKTGRLHVFIADYDGYRPKRAQCNDHHKHKNAIPLNCECADVDRFGEILMKLLQLYTTRKKFDNRHSSSLDDSSTTAMSIPATAAAAMPAVSFDKSLCQSSTAASWKAKVGKNVEQNQNIDDADVNSSQ